MTDSSDHSEPAARAHPAVGHWPREAVLFAQALLDAAIRSDAGGEMLGRFCTAVAEYFDCRAVGIRMVDELDCIPYQVSHGFSPEFLRSENRLSLRFDRCMCTAVISGRLDCPTDACTRKGSFFTGDIRQFRERLSPEQRRNCRNVCGQVGFRSLALVPIRMENCIRGLIHVADPRPGHIPPQAVEILETVADQVGLALLHIQARRQLDRSNEMLARHNEELEGIIRIASHDLRTPLINIRGFSEELSRDVDEVMQIVKDVPMAVEDRVRLDQLLRHSIREEVKFIDVGAARIESLLEALLKLARLGQSATRFEPLDMDELVAGARRTLQYQIQNARAAVEIRPLPACIADRDQIGQVVVNLLSNALKYADPSRPPQICIWGRPEDDRVVYCVEDNGLGVHPDCLESIFDIFCRHSPSDVPGEGLGLTIVRRIIDRHRGRVWVESTPGHGSRFYFALPAQRKKNGHRVEGPDSAPMPGR